MKKLRRPSIRMDDDLLDLIDTRAGKRRRSDYVRRAVEALILAEEVLALVRCLVRVVDRR